VQDVPYAKLRERLIEDGQILEYSGPAAGGGFGVDPGKLPGIVVDDTQAKVTGDWSESRAAGKWLGNSYRHDNNARDGQANARFEARLSAPGRYEVRLAYTPNRNRASNVAVEVQHANGRQTVVVNQQQSPPIDGLFVSLGVFEFAADQPAAVIVSNRDADGHVIIDGVQWISPTN